MLQIDHLWVNYGESRVLSDVSLGVPAGQVVCLMGRNGVGKTTLLKAIMGLLRPSYSSIAADPEGPLHQNRILFDGQDLAHRSPSRRARMGIGYVPQGRGIFPYLTVYENLLMGLEARTESKPEAAIEEMYDLFPVLKSMRARSAGTLSGGQQQQLALARALVGRPKLLLLDEPTEGIQPSIMLEIEDVILSLQAQHRISILLVEQFLDFALGVANYYYVMETGSIVAHGPIAEFDHAAAREYLAV